MEESIKPKLKVEEELKKTDKAEPSSLDKSKKDHLIEFFETRRKQMSS